MDVLMPDPRYELAAKGLVRIVRSEYPSDWSVAEIVDAGQYGADPPLTLAELTALEELCGEGAFDGGE